MLYSEIIRALPRDVSSLLQTNLDQAYVPIDADAITIREALNKVVDVTKQEARYDTETSRAMAGMLLGMVPEAATKILFD